MALPLPPWKQHMLKRARKNVRLLKLANEHLDERRQGLITLPPHHILGTHLGLIVLTNCSQKLFEIRARARWMLHWMLGYILEQGFTLEEAASEAALEALELLIVGAVQATKPHPNQLQFKMGRLLSASGEPIKEPWMNVYDSAWTFIGALDNIA